jgi:hypothetical protein
MSHAQATKGWDASKHAPLVRIPLTIEIASHWIGNVCYFQTSSETLSLISCRPNFGELLKVVT